MRCLVCPEFKRDGLETIEKVAILCQKAARSAFIHAKLDRFANGTIFDAATNIIGMILRTGKIQPIYR